MDCSEQIKKMKGKTNFIGYRLKDDDEGKLTLCNVNEEKQIEKKLNLSNKKLKNFINKCINSFIYVFEVCLKTVAEGIMFVIKTAYGIIEFIVKSMKDVCRVIVTTIKKIGIEIKFFFDLLGSIFNFKDIMTTSSQVKRYLMTAMDDMKTKLQSIDICDIDYSNATKQLDDVLNSIDEEKINDEKTKNMEVSNLCESNYLYEPSLNELNKK